MTDDTPTLYEWAGGAEAFERLTEVFYGKVREDDLLEPVFRHMDPGHPRHVAAWLAEVFGGPQRYFAFLGGGRGWRWRLAAGRDAAAEGTGAALGLGRGAALHRLSKRYSPGMCRTA